MSDVVRGHRYSCGVETMLPVSTSVLPRNEAGWALAEASALGARMKAALFRVACGESYREAAQAEGYATHPDVYRMAQRYGIVSATSERVAGRCLNVADLSLDELERRLTEAPEQFAPKELGVIAGIATDKIAKKERWGLVSDRPEGGMSALEQLADAASKGLISIDIQVRPSPLLPDLGEGRNRAANGAGQE